MLQVRKKNIIFISNPKTEIVYGFMDQVQSSKECNLCLINRTTNKEKFSLTMLVVGVTAKIYKEKL